MTGTDQSAPVVTNSADAMAMLLGAQVDPATGGLTTLPGTTPVPVAPSPAPGTGVAAPTAAEVLSLTGEEAIAKVNELLASQAAAQTALDEKTAEADRWKQQSRTNERAKKALAKALKDSGSDAGTDTSGDGVHTDDQDDDGEDSLAASTLRQENMRLRAALAAGLDESDAFRLVGDTPEALKADALALKKRFAAASMRPQGSADGASGGAVLKTLSPQQELAKSIASALQR